MPKLQGWSFEWQPQGFAQCWAMQRTALAQVTAPQASQRVRSQPGESEDQIYLLKHWKMQVGCLGSIWNPDALVKQLLTMPALVWSHLSSQQQLLEGCKNRLLAALLLALSAEAAHPWAYAEDDQAWCQPIAGGFQQPQQSQTKYPHCWRRLAECCRACPGYSQGPLRVVQLQTCRSSLVALFHGPGQ